MYILATNEQVDLWNEFIQKRNNNQTEHLFSADHLCEVDDPKNILRNMLTVDVLNNFNNNGVPPHNLKLKIGDICIVMRNLARKEGLTNNTRVQITKISKFCIRVQTLSAEPKVFLIPRIRFKFRLPFGQSFQLLRTQFPLRLAYCISINKSQGQEYDYSLSDLIQTSFRSWTSIFQRLQIRMDYLRNKEAEDVVQQIRGNRK